MTDGGYRSTTQMPAASTRKAGRALTNPTR